MEQGNNPVGQRLIWSLDLAKTFKHKQPDGTEVDLQRLYQIVLPYGAPFEEAYAVIEEFVTELKRIETVTKEQAAAAKAEQEAKAAQVATEEASVA